MNSKLILTGLIVLGAAIGVFFLVRKKGGVAQIIGKGCYDVPSHLKTWHDSDIPWGEVAQAVRDIGINNENEGDNVLGFLKGLNVAAKGPYVHYFKNEIQAHVNSSKKLPHWLVTTGQYRCDVTGGHSA
jgi:hypothetical protein